MKTRLIMYAKPRTAVHSIAGSARWQPRPRYNLPSPCRSVKPTSLPTCATKPPYPRRQLAAAGESAPPVRNAEPDKTRPQTMRLQPIAPPDRPPYRRTLPAVASGTVAPVRANTATTPTARARLPPPICVVNRRRIEPPPFPRSCA